MHSTQHIPVPSKQVKTQVQPEETLNLNVSHDKNLNDTSIRPVLDESSAMAQSYNAVDGLSDAYFQIFQNSRASNILHTLARLSQVCTECFETIRHWNRYAEQNYWLAEEANTWRLLYCLNKDLITEQPQLDALLAQPTLSQQTLVDTFFRADPELRLLQLVVDWLETTSINDYEMSNGRPCIMNYNVHCGNTENQQLIRPNNHQTKVIHSGDDNNDEYLYQEVFTQVRCGQSKKAISLCVNAGQAKLAAMLQGWIYLNYLPRKDTNDPPDTNSEHWKPSENMYSRAIIGILCGDLKSVLPLCTNSWQDLLWSHLRCQIVNQVKKLLCKHQNLTADTNSNTPEEMTIKQVFSEVLMGSKETKYLTCQRHLILDQRLDIMQETLNCLDNSNKQFICFAAHLVLVLRQMGKDPDENITDSILQSYITQLIEKQNEIAGCPELIAYYTSMLSVKKQITSYAELMYNVNESESRKAVVKAGVNRVINVEAAARVAIKNAITDIQETCGDMNLAFTEMSATEKDTVLVDRVISSLEWLRLIPNQLVEALWLCNAMIRTFISIENIKAALACVSSMENLFPNFLSQVQSNSSELKEYLCLKAYLEASESFESWNNNFNASQPKEVVPFDPDVPFTDKVHHDQICTKIEQQKMHVDQSRRINDALYKILCYPRGWLWDESNSSSSPNFTENEKEERNTQLETLRYLCTKDVVTMISNCKVVTE